MTTALERGKGSTSRPGRFLPPGKPGTHYTGGWVGPRASLDSCGKSFLTGIRSQDRPAPSQSLYRLRYPAHMFSGSLAYILLLMCETKCRRHTKQREKLYFLCILTFLYYIAKRKTKVEYATGRRSVAQQNL